MPNTTLNRRRFLGSLGLTAAALACPKSLLSAVQAAPRVGQGKPLKRKPNVILILSDDVGLDDIGCYGGGFKTPHIDALAAGGTRFEYCYSSPLCGPSRAELLTGRYAFRTGMESNATGDVMKPANETMLPRVLKPAGYVTASVGKWNQLPLQPGDWGFDEYFRFGGSGVYWKGNVAPGAKPKAGAAPKAGGKARPKAQARANYTANGVTRPIPEDVYVPDMMHDFLADFITRHKDQPFFAYYPMSHMHGKIVPTPDHPDTVGPRKLYADNIAYMDKLVGKLVALLDQLGLREDTLIIFTGDNGTAQGEANFGTLDGERINGQKNTMKEGGSRVPLIANWKGTTPAGKVNHDLTDFSDFMPTLAQLASAPLPTEKPIDGHSFLPQIKGEVGNPREWVYVELSGNRYVRDAKWKLNNAGELYDMKKAPIQEILVPATTTDPAAIAARAHLQTVMDNLVGKNAPPPTPLKNQNKGQKAQNGQKAQRAQKRANKAARKQRRLGKIAA
ncbi:arylsulfatase [Abditibacteriota bacterium]|nr:arylsulfatase [Abditibacteriota bacterium]